MSEAYPFTNALERKGNGENLLLVLENRLGVPNLPFTFLN